jgi:hypothetical protein
MVLPVILDPFAEGAASTVITRITLDWILDGTSLDALFDDVAQNQYTREFTLGHLVQVMLDVASGTRPSPNAAFKNRQLDTIASVSAFYRKLDRMELSVTAAVVRQTADRAHALIVAAGGLRPEPIPGYLARILDGNILAGTDHRLVPLRSTRSAALPGRSLAVYEPASGLIRDLVLEENAHAQERALLDQIVIEPGQLWIADRNFCVRTFLFRIVRSKAFFLIRGHASNLPFAPIEPLRTIGRCASGEVFEQAIWVDDPEHPGERHRLRRIVLRLDNPTRAGETEIVLVTNLADMISAELCCDVYRDRWQIEGHFQTLTDLLHCEIPTLGYPRAALFAFSMSVVAGNALAVLKGNLLATHGGEMADEVSNFALTREIAEIHPGMMIAVPPSHWTFVRTCSAEEVAELLNALATKIPIDRMLRQRRGAKKPRKAPPRTGRKIPLWPASIV